MAKLNVKQRWLQGVKKFEKNKNVFYKRDGFR